MLALHDKKGKHAIKPNLHTACTMESKPYGNPRSNEGLRISENLIGFWQSRIFTG
jgi:hypothetical protein